jgi:hypothetical protein
MSPLLSGTVLLMGGTGGVRVRPERAESGLGERIMGADLARTGPEDIASGVVP